MERVWLIVNHFVESSKFSDLYRLLEMSFRHRGVILEVRTACDIMPVVNERKRVEDLPRKMVFWDKDVILAKHFESIGVELFNSANAIEVCDNKALTALVLSKAGVGMPLTVSAPKTFEGVGYSKVDFIARAADLLKYPMVIKEVYGSFGHQVYCAADYDAACEIVRKIGYKDFIFQEFVASSAGRDVRINMVGGRYVAAMLRENSHDFRSNISNGGTMAQYEPSMEEIDIAVKAVQAIGLDFAGVDVMFGPNGMPLICEVNSNPHFRSTLDCTGVNIADYIADLVIGRQS